MQRINIDWAYEAPHNEIDTIWYARATRGSLMVASNPQFDALIIADTEEEIRQLAAEHGTQTFVSENVDISPAQTSLFALATRWRWFLYNGKARFLIGGNGWMPQCIAEYPGVQAGIAPDPMAMVYCARTADGMITKKGAPIVGGDVHEVISEIESLDLDNSGVEFVCGPMFAFAAKHRDVWYRGRVHDLWETLTKNPVLLAYHGIIDPSKLEPKDDNK